ncbi:FAD-binding oxidoreductase [Pseudactinotalea sp. HY158]|uniref:FAD-binding oxidoreductase n=1 Tax=Pseudactinotalea sp. HY158 TaxID=2654547 RepID=UPI00189286F0|nr:FAD-binding oxidoreductase [Pseudactinotalea sp. HY158]
MLTGEDPRYASAHSGFNPAAEHRPEVVVRVADAADIRAAIDFGAEHGLRVRAQATGHGKGEPMDGGLLVLTDRLRGVEVDPAHRTARVGAGARWQDLLPVAAAHGLMGLCGSTPAVGVVGYTLGGGTGPMGRTFGFNSDGVRRLRMIDAGGRELEIDAEREPDLFWAMRGGKPDVGIVTELEFDLVTAPTYYGGGVYFPGEQAERILHAFGDWAPSLPDSVTASAALLRLPDVPVVPEPLRGRLSVHLRFVHVGDPARGAELLAPMLAAGTPIVDLVAEYPSVDIASVHRDPTEPMPARDEGMTLRDLPPGAIDALLEAAGPGADLPLVVVELRHLGGALAREQGAASAVGGREAAYNVTVVGAYPPPLRPAVDAGSAAVLAALAPWATGGSLINFQGYATQRARAAWDAPTRARLDAIKERWDPERVFRFAYSFD